MRLLPLDHHQLHLHLYSWKSQLVPPPQLAPVSTHFWHFLQTKVKSKQWYVEHFWNKFLLDCSLKFFSGFEKIKPFCDSLLVPHIYLGSGTTSVCHSYGNDLPTGANFSNFLSICSNLSRSVPNSNVKYGRSATFLAPVTFQAVTKWLQNFTCKNTAIGALRSDGIFTSTLNNYHWNDKFGEGNLITKSAFIQLKNKTSTTAVSVHLAIDLSEEFGFEAFSMTDIPNYAYLCEFGKLNQNFLLWIKVFKMQSSAYFSLK